MLGNHTNVFLNFFKNTSLTFYTLLDIVVITKPTVGQASDPFTLANRIYLSHISGRPNSFLSLSADPYPDPENDSHVVYNLSLTLQPYQIFCLPVTLENKINPSLTNTHAIYTNDELRLVFLV